MRDTGVLFLIACQVARAVEMFELSLLSFAVLPWAAVFHKGHVLRKAARQSTEHQPFLFRKPDGRSVG